MIDGSTPIPVETVVPPQSFDIDFSGRDVVLRGERWESDNGGFAAVPFEIRDETQIRDYLLDVSPSDLEAFETRLHEWEANREWRLTAEGIGRPPFDSLDPMGRSLGTPDSMPSSPTPRAQHIDKPNLPQAVESSVEKPRAPEHRAAQVPSSSRDLPVSDCRAPRDFNEYMHQRMQDALRREVDRVDPNGDRTADLQTRVQQLPRRAREEVEGYLLREWIRSERERQSTVVIGRNGKVWTQGEEEEDQAREIFEQGLAEAGMVAGGLGSALGMSAMRTLGVTDHEGLMAAGEFFSVFDSVGEARASRGGTGSRSRTSSARKAPKVKRPGSRSVKPKPSAKPARRGIEILPPIRLNQDGSKSLRLTKSEQKLVERTAEIFREEMEARKGIKNKAFASQLAHEATQDRVVKEFGDAIVGSLPAPGGRLEPGTGASAPGHKRADVQAFHPKGKGILVELKRTAYVRADGTLVTKGFEANEPGQASQTDAFEVSHHQLGVPVVVIDSRGRIFTSTAMYDAKTGKGSWIQVGGPVGSTK